MEPRSPDRPAWPLGLILKVGVLNAVLVTVISATAMALLAGSGTRSLFVGDLPVRQRFWSQLPSLVDVVKVVALLCPITAVTGGCSGLLSGIALSVVILARSWHIGSVAGMLVKLVLASFVFAILFLVVMRWISSVPPSSLMLIGYFLAWLFAIPVSGLVFRRRFLASRQSG